jgi:hypothetical protein
VKNCNPGKNKRVIKSKNDHIREFTGKTHTTSKQNEQREVRSILPRPYIRFGPLGQ